MTKHVKPPLSLTTEAKSRRDDQEFLPAALEILETPPSPVKTALMLMICALVISTLAWAYIGRIDIFAIAQGKIRPIELVKTVQPVEGGRVSRLAVQNGLRVEAGSILLILDATEATADEASLRLMLAAQQGEVLRRKAAIEAAELPEPKVSALDWPDAIPLTIRLREERVLAGDLSQLLSQLTALKAQSTQKQAEIERLNTTIISQNNVLATIRLRVDMRTTLEERKSGSKASVIDAVEVMQQQETALATQQGQLAEAKAALGVLKAEEARLRAQFIGDNSQKLGEAERQSDDLFQRHAKAKARLEHMTLISPISGTVQGLAVTTVGQVVGAGQELMRIVPENATLEIEAYAENRDVGFIHEGDEAIIKIEAFPFIRYGTITGKVTHVAKDSIPAPDALKTEADPTQANKVQQSFAPAKQTQNLVYAVTVAPDVTTIDADGRKAPLAPGMSVSVEIKTGSRRILEYIFSPLVEIVAQAGRER